MPSSPRHLSFIGPLIAVLAFVFLAYFFGAQRTMQFGLTAQIFFIQFLLALAIFSVIFALLFRSRPFTRAAIAVFLLALVLVGIVEVYARIQEMSITSSTSCEPGHYEARWWPYQNHAIVCSKDGTEWIGVE